MRQIKATTTDYLFQNILYLSALKLLYRELLYRDLELVSHGQTVRVGRSDGLEGVNRANHF